MARGVSPIPGGNRVGKGLSRKKGTHPGSSDEERKRKFIQKLSEGGIIMDARRAARIGHLELRKWRKEDADFAALTFEAQREGIMSLEDVAMKRARTHSDRLLEFLLKGAAPGKYRERPLEDEKDKSITINIKGGLPSE